MNGLILKDLYNLKGSTAFIVLLTVLFALLFSWEMPEGMVLVSAAMAASLVSGSFSYDHSYGWNAIGIPRRMIVTSKFEIGFLFVFAGVLFGLLLALIFQITMGMSIDAHQMLSASAMSLGVGMVASSVICAVNYYVNPQRAQLVSTFFTAVCVSGSIIVCNTMREYLPNLPMSVSTMILASGLVLFAVMYVVSQRRLTHSDL